MSVFVDHAVDGLVACSGQLPPERNGALPVGQPESSKFGACQPAGPPPWTTC